MGKAMSTEKPSLKELAFCEKNRAKRIKLASYAFFHPSSSMADRWELKLWALREVAKRTGMIGPHRNPPPSHSEEKIEKCLSVLTSPDSHPYQKTAAGMLLEYYEPQWKNSYPEIAGIIAERCDSEVFAWRRAVFARDNWACKKCGSSENIEAHHLLMWAEFPHARLIVDNGLTLCKPCHYLAHGKKLSAIEVQP